MGDEKDLIYRHPAGHPAEQLQAQRCGHSRRVLYLWRAKDFRALTKLSAPHWGTVE